MQIKIKEIIYIMMILTGILVEKYGLKGADPELVKYFHVPEEDELLYLESLIVGDVFVLKNKVFVIEETTKKRYLCRNLKSGLKYKVNTLAQVRKIDDQYEKQ